MTSKSLVVLGIRRDIMTSPMWSQEKCKFGQIEFSLVCWSGAPLKLQTVMVMFDYYSQ